LTFAKVLNHCGCQYLDLRSQNIICIVVVRRSITRRKFEVNRYICIHGHFYQPPRENPWLEEVELQDSAYPYHDWNERITAECYVRNTASRILGEGNQIIDIVNNYSKMSFNFGPTLLSWMKKHSPDVYQSILDADKESQKMFSGHGAAIAQAYNHMIMPLSNMRDKRTQVFWGIKDFEYRFKRKPEGMWLPETAVNIESLECLAECGIQYTILAPYQAKRIKKIHDKKWRNIAPNKIDTKQPYLCFLPSGKKIHIFFYDGTVSHGVAFGDFLKNGENLANKLLSAFPEGDEASSLVHSATDGETYGHHQKFGEMALSYCLYHIQQHNLASITNYGEFLEKFLTVYEVEIHENTSWSCAHGVERWKTNCGCNIGSNSSWHQNWREPLRDALDWLRDSMIPIYEREMQNFCNDPWEVRNHYIELILDRSAERCDAFISKSSKYKLSNNDKVKFLKLLEMQRHAMLMYTSCGWFFDDISGIETTQVIQYAARAVQLAGEVAGVQLENEFINKLSLAMSNLPQYKNGALIYNRGVKSAITDLIRVGAHYALTSLFIEYPKAANIYCYTVNNEVTFRKDAGKQKLVIGKAHIRSDITWEEDTISYVALHMGDHNLNCGVRSDISQDDFKKMQTEINDAFNKGDTQDVLRLINQYFGGSTYTLWHLFKHEQKKIFDEILKTTMDDIEDQYRHIYEDQYFLMQARHDIKIPLPKALSTTIEFVLNRNLLDALNKDPIDVRRFKNIVDDVKRWSFEIDKETLGYVASEKINHLMDQFQAAPEDMNLLRSLDALLRLLKSLPVELDLWKAQNVYHHVSKQINGRQNAREDLGDKHNERWANHFKSLGETLLIKNE